MFDRFFDVGFKLKVKKCIVFVQKVLYFDYVILEGIYIDLEKVKIVRNWFELCDVSEVRLFFGFFGYYRQFIVQFVESVKLLIKLIEKGSVMEWIKECREVFFDLKERLCKVFVLVMLNFSYEFILDMDVSNMLIGVVLFQSIDGVERFVVYVSCIFFKFECQYCVIRKELFVVVYFIKYFKYFLYGKQFIVCIDYSFLCWFLNFKNFEGQLVWWLELLSVFDMKIEYCFGK